MNGFSRARYSSSQIRSPCSAGMWTRKPAATSTRQRSQASRIINDLRLIDSAVDQYAIETNKTSGATVGVADWTNYLKKGTNLYSTGADIFGNSYGVQTVDSLPKVPTTTKNSLSDVTDAAFWSPYN